MNQQKSEPRITHSEPVTHKEPKLTPRQEMILSAFEDNRNGPLIGKTVATLTQLDPDSRIRTDLSNLVKLGYLAKAKTGYGYLRTLKRAK